MLPRLKPLWRVEGSDSLARRCSIDARYYSTSLSRRCDGRSDWSTRLVAGARVATADSRDWCPCGVSLLLPLSFSFSPRARGSCVRRGRRSSFESGAAKVSRVCRGWSRVRDIVNCGVSFRVRGGQVYTRTLGALLLSLSLSLLILAREHAREMRVKTCSRSAGSPTAWIIDDAGFSEGPRSATRLSFPSRSLSLSCARVLPFSDPIHSVCLSLSFSQRTSSYPARAPPTQWALTVWRDG